MTDREETYIAYKRELCELSGNVAVPAIHRENLQLVENGYVDAEFIPIYHPETGEEIGGCILSRAGNLERIGGPDCDYFIQDFWIAPEHRGQGYGTLAMQKLLKEKPGTWGLYILNANTRAQNFWARVFKGRPRILRFDGYQDKDGKEYEYKVTEERTAWLELKQAD